MPTASVTTKRSKSTDAKPKAKKPAAKTGTPAGLDSFPTVGEVVWNERGKPKAFTKIELTPDNQGILLASFEEIMVIDVATGKARTKFKKSVSHVAWLARMSPDGARVVSAFGNFTIHVWDAKTAQETFTATTHERIVMHLSLSQDGKRAMSAAANNRIALWDIAKGAELGYLELKKSLACSCALGGEGRFGAYGGTDGYVRLYDFEKKTDVWTSAGKGWIEAMDASADGKMFASTGRGKSILLWDAKSGKNLRAIDLGATGTEVSLSRDASAVVAVSGNKSPTVYATATGKPLGVLAHPAKVISARFSHDATRIVTCDTLGTMRVFDVS
jgi:WD40 repeat protein